VDGFYEDPFTQRVMRPRAFSCIRFKRPFFFEVNKQFREYFNLSIPLGSGSTCCVRKCDGKERATHFAVKLINIDCYKEMLNEVNILKRLYHPCVVDICEVLEEPKKLYLLEEPCMGGDLANNLATRPVFNEEEAAHIIKSALQGLAYCHKNKVVHRNLKPGDLILKKSGGRMVKLIDFGGAADLNIEHTPLSKVVGVPCYMAPEVLKECYNEKADIWSIGVLTYELLSGKLPFDGESDQQIVSQIRSGGSVGFHHAVFNAVSREAKDFISRLLMHDAGRRFNAVQALNHPWLSLKAQCKPEPHVMRHILKNMRDFRYQFKFQEAILALIVHRFVVREDQENLERAFLELDRDFDGVIGYQEFAYGFERYYFNAAEELTSEEISLIFERCDLDGDGFIDYHDFLICGCDKIKALSRPNLEETFYTFDRFQKGYLTFDDFEMAYGQFSNEGERVWDDILKEVLDNEDGLMNMQEMFDLMNQMLE